MAETWFGQRASGGFADMPDRFYARVAPQPLTAPRMLHANPEAAALIGLPPDVLARPEFLSVCAGEAPLPGIDPVASVYSGHQFGVWAGQLGDGRAHLLGSIQGPEHAWELQLKGSGRTPYARMGDGRAVLRSSVREYLASEAMAGLGIPTTRALALVVSDDPVYRETVETAAIVARLSPSYVRFGHFEHWAHSHHDQKALLAHVIECFLPECGVMDNGELDVPATTLNLLSEVVSRTARLIAQWQLVGFCHGVMNTDNMSILGLTLDYGPYGFMDAFQANHVCNHSDAAGRYAWNAQPAVAQWNLYRLAGSLMVLGCDAESLKARLQPFEREFLEAYHRGLVRKFGFASWREGDDRLTDDWWALLHGQQADFTLAFRTLGDVADRPEAWLSLFPDTQAAKAWLVRYQARLDAESENARVRVETMRQANPLYVLRNYLAQEAIEAAQQGDASVIDRLLVLLRDPWTEQPGGEHFAYPPRPDMMAVAVSCSS